MFFVDNKVLTKYGMVNGSEIKFSLYKRHKPRVASKKLDDLAIRFLKKIGIRWDSKKRAWYDEHSKNYLENDYSAVDLLRIIVRCNCGINKLFEWASYEGKLKKDDKGWFFDF